MIKRFSYLLIAPIFLLSSSCSTLWTKSDELASKDGDEETFVDQEKATQELEMESELTDVISLKNRALAHVHTDNSHIIGSAVIDKPVGYDRKTYFLYGAEHLNLDNYYFDIPVVYNDAVKKWMNYFLKRGRRYFQGYSQRAGRYAPILGKILEEQGLPRDFIFLAMAESGFNTKAKSWAKAVGPWQFMPYTGKRYGLKIDWYVDERQDPIKATIAAGNYLKKLYGDFGSWELAMAAYNAGEGKIGRAIKRYRTENFWDIRKGRYLKPETKNYVPKIMALAILGKNLGSFGFEEIDFHAPMDFEEVSVAGGIDLNLVARDLEVPFSEIQKLNPELRRWFTPHNMDEYRLRVPVGKKIAFDECCRGGEYKAVAYQKYRVRGSRSSLRDVAKKFKIKGDYVLSDINNGLSPRKRLKKGSYVFLPFRKGQSKKARMYADLYDKPRRSVLRKRRYRKQIRVAKRRGKKIVNPSRWYTVKKGDSLWSVARKTGTPLNTIIASNMGIVQNRMIRAGDKLVVR